MLNKRTLSLVKLIPHSLLQAKSSGYLTARFKYFFYESGSSFFIIQNSVFIMERGSEFPPYSWTKKDKSFLLNEMFMLPCSFGSNDIQNSNFLK